MKNSLAIALAFLITPTSVLASNYPSFSYLEISAVGRTLEYSDNEEVDLTGQRAKLSLEIGDTLFINGEVSQTDGKENFNGDILESDLEVNTIGIGIKSDDDPNTSWFAEVSHGRWTLEETETFGGFTDSVTIEPDVTILALGFRSMASPNLELNGSIQRFRIDFDNADEFDPADVLNGNLFQLGLVYRLTGGLHVAIDYSEATKELDISTLNLGLRYSF